MPRRIYLPRTAADAACSMATYGIPLLVLATTQSASLTGVVFALEWLPRLAAFGPAGSMVDRHGATRVFRVASVVRVAVVVLAVLALHSTELRHLWTVMVMLLAAALGVLTEFTYVAAETAGAMAVRDTGAQAHRVQAALLGIDQTATLLGPALGGVLLEWAGARAMLATIAVLSLVAAVITPRFRGALAAGSFVPVAQGMRNGWAALRAIPALGWLVTGMTFSNLAVGTVQAGAPLVVVRELGGSSASAGFVWSAAAAASLLTIALCRFAIDRYGLWPVGAVAAAVASVACAAAARAGSYPSYLVLVAVFMAGDGGLTVVLRTLRTRLIPAEVFGSTLSLTVLILLLPFPLAGVVVALTPPGALGLVLTVCAAIQAAALVLTFVRLRTDPALRGPAPAREQDR